MTTKRKPAVKARAVQHDLELVAKVIHEEKPHIKRLFLNPSQYFDLMQYTRDEYVKQGVTDKEFATAASAALGFQVKDSHVSEARKKWGLPNTLRGSNGDTRIITRLEKLEAWVKAIAEGLGVPQP
jgi:hypothetical protein